jgi:hypothetical protein
MPERSAPGRAKALHLSRLRERSGVARVSELRHSCSSFAFHKRSRGNFQVDLSNQESASDVLLPDRPERGWQCKTDIRERGKPTMNGRSKTVTNRAAIAFDERSQRV